MTTTAQDTVIRLAMGCMAIDQDSALTLAQRTWIRDRLLTLEALTPAERQKLQAPLCAWATTRMPTVAAIVARQFEETTR